MNQIIRQSRSTGVRLLVLFCTDNPKRLPGVRSERGVEVACRFVDWTSGPAGEGQAYTLHRYLPTSALKSEDIIQR